MVVEKHYVWVTNVCFLKCGLLAVLSNLCPAVIFTTNKGMSTLLLQLDNILLAVHEQYICIFLPIK